MTSYGLSFKSQKSFTGERSASLPFLVQPPYSLPVTGMDARFLATHNVETSDTVSWGSTVGDMTLRTSGVATSPDVTDVDGRRALSFDGVSDELRYDFSEARAQPFTLATVFKLNTFDAAGTGTRVIIGGTSLSAARTVNAGALQVVQPTGFLGYAGGGLAVAGPKYGDITPVGWHVAVISFNGSTSISQVDQFKRGPLNAGGLPRSAISVGGERNTFYTACSVSEVVTWPRALDATEISSVVTAMQGQYGLV